MKKVLLLSLMAMSIIACKKNVASEEKEAGNFVLTPNTETLLSNETVTFSISKNGKLEDLSQFEWAVSDTLRGAFAQKGIFKAKRIGDVRVTAKRGNIVLEAVLKITPKETYITEPLMLFGQTKDVIKSEEKRELEVEISSGLLYKKDRDGIRGVLYTFDDNNKKMTGAFLLLDGSGSFGKRSLSFINERYVPVTNFEQDGYSSFVFKPLDNKPYIIYVLPDHKTFGYCIIYSFDENKSLSSFVKMYNSAKGKIINL